MKKTKISFLNELPKFKNTKNFILIYDKILINKDKSLSIWIRQFPRSYAVDSGETLKDTKSFHKNILKIIKLCSGLSKSEIEIVSIGGGSVGDFSGFTASILKRGVRLTHIPSTWLAAIDSAHGGKTALNVDGIKNQIGSFYPANKIFICKKILSLQPQQRAFEAWGEIIKTGLLAGNGLWKKVKSCEPTTDKIWPLLPSLINYKNSIVKKDPQELKGLRFILNFGHTMGHVFESEHQVPHGLAVLYGTSFAVQFSDNKNILEKKYAQEIFTQLPNIHKILLKTKKAKFHLMQDKKMSRNHKINFIFLKKPGFPVIKKISINEILTEIKRQIDV